MTKTAKLLALTVAMTAAAVLSTTGARADSINFAGNITLDQGGTGCVASPCQSITFGQLTVDSTTPGGTTDAVAGTAASITGNIDYVSTTGTEFNPSSATLSLGSATAGTLTGKVDFIDLSGGSGAFSMDVGLSNLVISKGTSGILDEWAASNSHSGNGIFTFQFLGGVSNTADLLSLSGSNTTTVSGSVGADLNTSSVPEPSTLLLFGTALLAGAFMFRKLYSSESSC